MRAPAGVRHYPGLPERPVAVERDRRGEAQVALDCLPVSLVRRGQSRIVKQRTEVCVGGNLDAPNNLTSAASYCRTGAGKEGLITGRPSSRIAGATRSRSNIPGRENTSGVASTQTDVTIGIT